MQYEYDYAVLDGDLRQVYLANLLIEKGYHVNTFGLTDDRLSHLAARGGSLEEVTQSAPAVLGAIPFCYEYEALPLAPGQCLFAGRIPEAFAASCKENGISVYDYMSDTQLPILNAIATAEGTISEAISHFPDNIHGTETLLLGYGTCAKVLADKLKALSAKVTVCARSPHARAEAVSMGYSILDFSALKEMIHHYPLIINTVPAFVLKEEILAKALPDCLILDIASSPGGLDQEAAQALCLNALNCPGLPGKYAPKASARYLAETIFHVNHNIY